MIDLATIWQLHFPDLPQPVAEFRFLATRRLRFDYAFPEYRVAIELDGGQWIKHGQIGGRHNSDTDRAKLNEAAANGWLVFRFSNNQWQSDIIGCLTYVARGLQLRLNQTAEHKDSDNDSDVTHK